MNAQFDHEKLDVYQVSLEVNRRVNELAAKLRQTNRYARDQLIRAALSIPLNIAEGNGKRPGADRAKYFEIARGSATESAATFDVLAIIGACSAETSVESKGLLVRIVAMLTRMIETNVSMVREDGGEYHETQRD